MKGIAGYREAKAITPGSGAERLPVGGYVVRIIDVKEETNQYGSSIVFRIDIAEGDYKDFYDKQYKESYYADNKWKGIYWLNIPSFTDNTEEGKKRYNRSLGRFKSHIEAINTSNNINIDCASDWDISALKNRIVGAVFVDKEWEYDGRTGWYTACHHFVSVEDIRTGNFKVPKPIPLKKEQKTTTNSYDASDFEEVESNAPVPF